MSKASTICNRCGKAVPSESRFCLECGSDLTGGSGDANASSPSAKTRIDQGASEQALFETLRQATLGQYDIIAEVGRGGMANVYLAHDVALDRKVAIKVISPELLRMGEGVVERFQREARTAASLSHPHIIPIYAVKESDRILFFVMKFVEGRTLESVVREEGQLPVPMVQTILNQVGSALDYAHKRGVIHRDIKPGNIMLDEGGWAVVTDFGIAKVTEADGLTMTGATVGTPSYMSPEQCAGQPLSGAVDQYALAVVAYEMLTGRLPFEGDSAMTVMYKHTHEPPPSIHAIWPECPRPLGNAIMRMLAKDPHDRYATMQAAIDAVGMADRDDTVRTRMVSLAKSGGNAKLLEQFKTPKSSIPRPGAFKTRGTPTNVSAPIVDDDSGAQDTSRSLESSSRSSKAKFIFGIPALAGVLGGVAWAIVSFSGPGSEPVETTPTPVQPPMQPPVAGPVVADMTVEPLTVTLETGLTQQLTLVATDSSGSNVSHEDAEVSFTTANSAVADVSVDGLVTALAAGNTTVTARAGTHSVTIPVMVSEPQRTTTSAPSRPTPQRATVASVLITPDRIATARVGDAITLQVSVQDGRGNRMNESVTWRSSNNGIASVSSNGEVTAKAEGVVNIIAQAGRVADTSVVTVAPLAVESISVTPASTTLDIDGSVTLTARLADANGNQLQRSVTWTSSSPGVASVTAGGVVRGVSDGTAVITASVENRQATARVTVRAAEVLPQPRDPAADRRAIQDAIERYRVALENEDLAGMQAIFSDMPRDRAQRLSTFFETVENLSVTADVGPVNLQGDAATVQVDFHYRFRAGGTSGNSPDPQQLSFRRESGRWVIVSIQ